MRTFRSHGDGSWSPTDLRRVGQGCIFEAGVLVFHPEHIELGDNIYIGHRAILKGYHQNLMIIGRDCWIGQDCFLHAAGGLTIGPAVGIGPGVRILTSLHADPGPDRPIMEGSLEFRPVEIGEGSDIGTGAIILPGVRIGRGVQVGAGAVVTRDLPDLAVAAGNPARVLRMRDGSGPPLTRRRALEHNREQFLKLLRHRYGALSEAVVQRVAAASQEQLDDWGPRLFSAATAEAAVEIEPA